MAELQDFMRMSKEGEASLHSMSSLTDDVANYSELPELPGIALFLVASALLHLILIFVLDGMRDVSMPGKYTILQVRLTPKVEPPPQLLLPDLYEDSIRAMRSNLNQWTSVALDKTSRLASTGKQFLPDAPDGVSASKNIDYYHEASELDEQPAPLWPVTPIYPSVALENGVEGYAKLLVLIDEDGKVRDIEMLESSPPDVFGDAAIDAFRAMTFKPGQMGFFPVKSRMVIQVDFKVGAEVE